MLPHFLGYPIGLPGMKDDIPYILIPKIVNRITIYLEVNIMPCFTQIGYEAGTGVLTGLGFGTQLRVSPAVRLRCPRTSCITTSI